LDNNKAQEELGKKIRESREAKGLSLRQMSKDLNISVSFLSEIERGNKRCPDDVITAICNYLGENEDEFFIAAGRVPPGIMKALRENPRIQDLVREVSTFLDDEDVNALLHMIYRLKRKNTNFPFKEPKRN
jgi:transcriptional regulator with XRE-family HTH domain